MYIWKTPPRYNGFRMPYQGTFNENMNISSLSHKYNYNISANRNKTIRF